MSVPEIGERDPGYSVIVGCKYNASSDLIKSAFLLINNTNHIKLSGKSIRLSPPPRVTPDISRFSGLRVRKAAQSEESKLNLVLYQLPEKLQRLASTNVVSNMEIMLLCQGNQNS